MKRHKRPTTPGWYWFKFPGEPWTPVEVQAEEKPGWGIYVCGTERRDGGFPKDGYGKGGWWGPRIPHPHELKPVKTVMGTVIHDICIDGDKIVMAVSSNGPNLVIDAQTGEIQRMPRKRKKTKRKVRGD
jgi:hypothetical protein